MRVTDKCDAYSFGVVALEIMMGRHPGELLQSQLATSSTFSESRGDLFLKDVLDQRLSPPTGELAKAVVVVVSLAFACTSMNPRARPAMCFVAKQLSEPTLPFPSEPFDIITIGNLIRETALR
ncbi:hypothetical protein TIFTF001_053844 [Ficus carica]|uniref:non-specific serine/threonine protein kinase n=1 Tax=Ficus carica TaxID=3494 RepID=A0AA88JH31_FICCA|nr:hypothetical protein TIFTF001_053844 [Ficus carica]